MRDAREGSEGVERVKGECVNRTGASFPRCIGKKGLASFTCFTSFTSFTVPPAA